jgi:hypothetical protein
VFFRSNYTVRHICISEFVPYGMNLSHGKNRIDPMFVCCTVRHLPNMLDCINTPLTYHPLPWRYSISRPRTPHCRENTKAQATQGINYLSVCILLQKSLPLKEKHCNKYFKYTLQNFLAYVVLRAWKILNWFL